jgi:hypothetical protein
MITIIKQALIPSKLLQKVSPVYDSVLQSEHNLRFYYKGGADTICINRGSMSLYTVHIPQFSLIKDEQLVGLVDGLKGEIDSGMHTLGIPNDQFFLFDTVAKIILSRDSFIDLIPHRNFKHVLFMAEDKPEIMYLADTYMVNYELQFLMTIVAKRELLRPVGEEKWTSAGKLLLAYILSNKYKITGEFSNPSLFSFWDKVVLDFDPDSSRDGGNPLLSQTLRFDRLDVLYDKVHVLGKKPAVVPVDKTAGGDTSTNVTLTDFLSGGIKSFSFYKTLDLYIDVCREIYKSVIVDTKSGACIVELMPGCHLTDDEVKSELCLSDVSVIREPGVDDEYTTLMY